LPTLAGSTKWQFLDPLIVALPVAVLVTIAASYMTKPPEQEHLDKCFEGI
jgi:SSS family solute:Na+ symporter